MNLFIEVSSKISEDYVQSLVARALRFVFAAS
jgi:hypothetical protein